MARRRIDRLRDDVITAAGYWRKGVVPFVEDPPRTASQMLADAIDALNAYIVPIIDSPGEYVEGSPETSRNAALAAAPLLGSVRRKIVDEILSVQHYGNHGLTDEELEARLRCKHQTLSSARNHLVNIGWVTATEWRRVSSAGMPTMVWALTPAAIERLKAEACGG